METDISRRILSAVSGDAEALSQLARAIAAQDTDGVRQVLGSRGVDLDADAAGRVLSMAGSGDGSATGTCTCTCTCT